MEIGGLEKYYYFKKLEWQSKKISNMNKSLSLGVKKKINIHEKIFYYYYVQYPFALYIHKVFILIEMQIFNFLVKVKIVPYIFLSKELCFYNLVFVNRRTIRDPYYIVGIYDTVMVPIEIYQYFFFPKSAFNYYSSYYYKFFKFY